MQIVHIRDATGATAFGDDLAVEGVEGVRVGAGQIFDVERADVDRRDVVACQLEPCAIGIVDVGLLDAIRAGDAAWLLVGGPGVAASPTTGQVAGGVVAIRLPSDRARLVRSAARAGAGVP